MNIEQITIPVDADIANAYYGATDEYRRKLNLVVNLRLRNIISSPESLKEVMKKISQNAQKRGLTPDILHSILNDE